MSRWKAQQAEIDALKSQLAGKDQQVVAAQQSAADAQTQAETATHGCGSRPAPRRSRAPARWMHSRARSLT